jgi:uncharacterized protein YndB with AHSA1/START domain
MEEVRRADGDDPLGLGFVRRMHTPAGKLEEEIVSHERPRLIEYAVTNGEQPQAKIHNHLGRIELTENPGGGTHVDYTVTFDYKPPALGPVSAMVLRTGWALRGKRKLKAAFPG